MAVERVGALIYQPVFWLGMQTGSGFHPHLDRHRLLIPRHELGGVGSKGNDIHAAGAALKAQGCNVLDEVNGSEYSKFAWVIDPEGNMVELWQLLACQ